MAPDGPVPARFRTALGRLASWLHRPEDAASLAVFRFAFGAVMAWDLLRYVASAWGGNYFYSDAFLFKYFPFGWVDRLPPTLMTVMFCTTALAAVGVALGACYRLCAVLLFLGHGYIFLMSAAHYLNHAYLICILTFLMIFLPAHRALSVDAWWRPSWARRELPHWARGLLVFQLALVYTYGGIAKINSDWLVYRSPISQWLQNAARRLGGLGGEILASDVASYVVTYGGCAYDLLVAPALLWKRTRPYAVAASVVFHLTNAYMFNIGVFPYLMLAATPLFFPAHWPRLLPRVGTALGNWVDRGAPWTESPSLPKLRMIHGMLAFWVAFQVLMPLRHLLYPGDVAWTEEGHMYSWRMKLRSKHGRVTYRVVDPSSGKVWHVDPATELGKRQLRKLSGRPEFILQYAHHLERRFQREEGIADPEVYADAFAALNYRKRQRFIDPKVDLSEQQESLWRARWILPFEWTPPPPPRKQR